MINYIIKYQNSYVYSYLFQQNLMKLMKIGIEISDLLQSNVFIYQFDYQEWPSIHFDHTEQLRGYNSTLFKLKFSYKEVFRELEDVNKDEDQNKLYKIKYSLNILPSII